MCLSLTLFFLLSYVYASVFFLLSYVYAYVFFLLSYVYAYVFFLLSFVYAYVSFYYRYMNTWATRALLHADRMDQAEKVVALFSTNDGMCVCLRVCTIIMRVCMYNYYACVSMYA